jgi:hypothetical protein
MQLYPQEEYVIARGLEDHLDSTTYYVRAFVRNAKTDALLATLDLEDQGDSHRFKKTWQVPADPTGMGFWINIQTSVYTDSGYTTKADNYGDKYEEKFIEARRHFAGGGGVDVDYKRVREIIQDELDKRKPEPAKPTEPVNFSPVLSAVSALRDDVSAIHVPEPKDTDLSPVMAKIDGLKRAVDSIDIPTPDFSGIEYRLDSLEEKVDGKELAALKTAMEEMFEKIKPFFGADMDAMNKKMDELKRTFSKIAYVTLQTNANDDEE